ncbi:kinase-like domain-containing protein, partial [Xylaria sp. FL1042]
MSGITPSQDGSALEQNPSTVWPGWTRDLPHVTQLDGTIRIQEYGIRFKDDNDKPPFYPLPLLQHVFTEQALSVEMNALSGICNRTSLIKQVLGHDNTITYIKVFAILKVIDRLDRLPAFVQGQVSDQELPLTFKGGQPEDGLYGKSGKPLPGDLLKGYTRKSFYTEQYNMLPHFFQSRDQPCDLRWRHVLPYYKVAPTKTSTELEYLSGSFGSVSKILIHPLCHGFNGKFNETNEHTFFALKEYHKGNIVEFQREVKMLQRFKHTNHQHIVTLLAAYTQDQKHFLVFPWADYDLGLYWQMKNPTPNSKSAQLVQWICNQAWKLSEAVSRIHDLDEDSDVAEEERLYGRHGDLKPDNILWYRSGNGFGNLVITDMGLSKTHRFKSRTYTLHNKPTAAPRYRPPEVEYEGSLMGRTFDIWTLGCVFLEFLIWLHGGSAKLEEILETMMSPSIRGGDSEDYFEWVRVGEDEYYAIRVKEAVTKCIEDLRGNCAQFAYDFLDIIANQMLVVERNERISAKELTEKMKSLSRNCDKNRDYCVRKKDRRVRDAPGQKLHRKTFREGLSTKGKNNVPRLLINL